MKTNVDFMHRRKYSVTADKFGAGRIQCSNYLPNNGHTHFKLRNKFYILLRTNDIIPNGSIMATFTSSKIYGVRRETAQQAINV